VEPYGDVEIGCGGGEGGRGRGGAERRSRGGQVLGAEGSVERWTGRGRMVKPAVVMGCMFYNFMVIVCVCVCVCMYIRVYIHVHM